MHIYIFTCYMPKKLFYDKSTCYGACVKKTKFSVKNKAFDTAIFFNLFYIDHKKYRFSAKLYKHT
jgi:hypothetical protein